MNVHVRFSAVAAFAALTWARHHLRHSPQVSPTHVTRRGRRGDRASCPPALVDSVTAVAEAIIEATSRPRCGHARAESRQRSRRDRTRSALARGRTAGDPEQERRTGMRSRS